MAAKSHWHDWLVVSPKEDPALPGLLFVQVQRMSFRMTRTILALRSRYLFVTVVVLCGLVGYGTYRLVFASEIAREATRNYEHLETLSQTISTTLQKYDELPLVIAQDPRMREALAQPNRSAALAAANQYLEQINQILGTETIYAMNEHGLTLVSSNWNKPDSYVGDNYAFRPYFVDAVGQGLGKFYGIGIASGKAGYYIAYPIRADQGLLGVITIKIGLADIQQALAEVKNDVIVTNEEGIVILSSTPAYRYKATRPIDPSAAERISQTRQFSGQSLDMLEYQGVSVSIDTNEPVTLLGGDRYMLQSVALGNRGWHIAQIGDTREARHYALASALATGFGLGFLLISLSSLYYRYRMQVEKRAIYADIDAKIAERTVELTNRVADLQRAESVLRQTRDEAVQAGKMAVLGQMAAGITHELSQPLSAIQLYAGNTRKLMEAGRLDVAGENVDNINALVVRAGNILSELKSLYRNDPTTIEPLSLGSVIRNAMLVMTPFVDKAGIALDVQVANEQVMGSQGKLEQVFVNLLSNAVDALRDRAGARVEIRAETRGSEVRVRIRDNGPGIPEAQRKNIFEPFFTTKPSGQGLGLGLAISRFIVDAVGGKIDCNNLPEGGLEFTLTLRNAEIVS